MPFARIDPADYAAQLTAKLERFKADFAPYALPEPAVHPSAPQHYRLRAEFRIWHQDERLDYAMFDPEAPKRPVILDDFPIAATPIRTAAPTGGAAAAPPRVASLSATGLPSPSAACTSSVSP